MRHHWPLWLLMYFACLLLSASLSTAADPGHPASAISSGTFESGNYAFPADVNVSSNLTVWGNLGIGTAAPSYLLDVNGSTRLTYLYFSGGSEYLKDDYGLRYFGSADQPMQLSGSSLLIGYSASGVSYPGNNLLVNGNVGIGNSTPSTTLFVNGTFSVMNISGTQGLYQDANGREGLGRRVQGRNWM
jgi:hypothetical protein